VLLTPDEVESFTAGAALNTDDNARIEFAAPRDLLGYAKFDPYLAKVYGPQWPYGRLTAFLSGFDTPDAMARLARSLFGHGKLREATLWTQRAEAAGGGDTTTHARLLLDLVATRLDRDPEIPLTLGAPLEPPHPPAAAEQVAREYPEVDALVRAHKFVTAYKIIEKWPTALWDKPPRDFALLAGFLHYKAEFYGDAIDLLKPLAAPTAADYVREHPAALYYLGRAQYANADYEKALVTLERYVLLQRAARRAVLPATAPERSQL
jgi:tetratricopeptide (TPR) repeat protein